MTHLPPANLPLPSLPEGRFAAISIDPPWSFRSRAATQNPHIVRSPDRHYPTMDLDAIAAIPVSEIAAPDAFIFLWITSPLLVHGVHVDLLRGWGFRPSSVAFVWVKLQRGFETGVLRRTPLLEADLHFGMGYTTRQNAEICILGRRGSPRRNRADIRQVIVAPVREHSRKPDEFFARVEQFCDGPRLDMFAGADRPGWTRWGYPHRPGEGIAA